MAKHTRDPEDRRPMIRRRALLMVLAGLLVSAGIFFHARPEGTDPFGTDPMDSRSYVRQLELYGGDANLISVEFQQWFLSLWHGRRLAYTILVISVAASAFYLLVASRMELLRLTEKRRAAPPPAT